MSTNVMKTLSMKMASNLCVVKLQYYESFKPHTNIYNNRHDKENIILVLNFLNHINCGENTLQVIIDHAHQ
jgi:hypothetical protein